MNPVIPSRLPEIFAAFVGPPYIDSYIPLLQFMKQTAEVAIVGHEDKYGLGWSTSTSLSDILDNLGIGIEPALKYFEPQASQLLGSSIML